MVANPCNGLMVRPLCLSCLGGSSAVLHEVPLLSTIVALSVEGLLLLQFDGVNFHQSWPVLVILLVPVLASMPSRVGYCLLVVAVRGSTLFFASLIKASVDPDGHYRHGT